MEDNIPTADKKKRRPYKQTCWEKNEKTIGGKDLKKQTQWEYGKEINSLWVLTRILQKEFEKDLIKNFKMTLKPCGDMQTVN